MGEKPRIGLNQSYSAEAVRHFLSSPIGRLPDPIAEQFRRCGLNVMRWKPARMKIAAP
jgi:hypothetical protein